MPKSSKRLLQLVLAAALLLGGLSPARAQTVMTIPGDVNGDNAVNVTDVQGVINQALGTVPVTPEGDLDGSGGVDVQDVQLTINLALGTPTFTRIDPDSARSGQTVALLGGNLSATPGDYTVMVDGLSTPVTAVQMLAGQVVAVEIVVPQGVQTGTISLTLSGQLLATRSFTFIPGPPPLVVQSVDPANGTTPPPSLTGSSVLVTFAEAVVPSTVTEANFRVSAGGADLPGILTMEASGSAVRWVPVSPLMPSTVHDITLVDIAGASGTQISTAFTSQFTTGAIVAATALEVTPSALTPAAGDLVDVQLRLIDPAGMTVPVAGLVELAVTGAAAPNGSMSAPSTFPVALANGQGTLTGQIQLFATGVQTLTAGLSEQPETRGQAIVTVAPGGVDSLAPVLGNDQAGAAGEALADSITLQALDAFGNPVESGSVSAAITGSARFEVGRRSVALFGTHAGEQIPFTQSPYAATKASRIRFDASTGELLYCHKDRVRAFNPATGQVRTVSRRMDGDPAALTVAVRSPTGELFAVDTTVILKDNNGVLEPFAGLSENGFFNSGFGSDVSTTTFVPDALDFDSAGNLYITITTGGSPGFFTQGGIMKIDATTGRSELFSGDFQSAFTSLGVIHRRDARYSNITGMAIHDDVLFVIDATDLRAINIGTTPKTVMTRSLNPDFTRFVGSSTVGDGYLTADPNTGDLYTARQSSHEITKVDGTSGQVSLFAGQAFQVGGQDGPLATATFDKPRGVAFDGATGTLYASEFGLVSNRPVGRLRVLSGGQVSTIPVKATPGFFVSGQDFHEFDPGITDSDFIQLGTGTQGGFLFYGAGRLYESNSADELELIAGDGNAGVTGDGGPATQAALGFLDAVVSSGDLIFLDSSDVRVINRGPSPVTFLAGTPDEVTVAPGNIDSLTGLTGQFSSASAMTVDRDSGVLVYISSNTVRLYNPGVAPATIGGVTVPPDTIVDHPTGTLSISTQRLAVANARIFGAGGGGFSPGQLYELTLAGEVPSPLGSLFETALQALEGQAGALLAVTTDATWRIDFDRADATRIPQRLGSEANPNITSAALLGDGRIILGTAKQYPHFEEISPSSRLATATADLGAGGLVTLPRVFLGPTPESGIATVTAGTASATIRFSTTANGGRNDADADGLSDEAETAGGSMTAQQDSDGDGLSDAEEQGLGTNPNIADSDGDGLNDGDELFTFGTDPRTSDSDGDGVDDNAEVMAGTDPLNAAVGGTVGFDATPPRPTGSTPAGGASSVATDTPLLVGFSEPLDAASVNAASILAFSTDRSGAIQSITIQTNLASDRLTVTPSAGSWPANARVEVFLGATGARLRDAAGNDGEIASVVFTTRAAGGAIASPLTQEPITHPTCFETTPGGLHNRAGGGMPTMTTGSGAAGALDGLMVLNGVVASTGEFVSTIPLMGKTPVRGAISPTLLAVYRSRQENVDEGIGWNWRLSFNRRLVEQSNGDVVLEAADRRRWLYTSLGGNTYQSPAGFYDQLLRTTSGWSLRRKHGSIHEFDNAGFLVECRDACGNRTQFARSPSGRLNMIIDDLGRITQLNYDASDHLVEVVDFTGRVTTLTYNPADQLESVTTPASEYIDESGATVTGGKRTQFTYSGAGAGAALEHNLLTIRDPRGSVWLENVYSSGDRVVAQRYGAGTLFYSYDPRRGRSLCVDRNGNLSEIRYDERSLPVAVRVWTNRNLREDDPDFFETRFEHDSQGEVTAIILPRGNAVTVSRDALGNVTQVRRKTERSSAPETDLVTSFRYESEFSRLIEVLEPRGHEAGLSAAQIDAYRSYFYYDHEDISARLASDSSRAGATVRLVSGVPSLAEIYQTVNPTTFQLEPDTRITAADFLDNDGDGFPDRGGRMVAYRGPRPRLPLSRFTGLPAAVQATLGLDPTPINNENDGTGNPLLRQVIEGRMTWNVFGQATSVTEPDGDRHGVVYNEAAFDLTTNPTAGYAVQTIRDLLVERQLVSVSLDALGRPLAVTSARGHTSAMEWNDIDLPVRSTSPAPFLYERRVRYDANNNVVATEIDDVAPQDLNDNGLQDGAGEQFLRGVITHRTSYDILNDPLEVDVDAGIPGGAAKRLISRVVYDGNKNVVEVQKPEGNRAGTSYDERDLPITSTAGLGDVSAGTTRMEFDANANLVAVFDDDASSDPSDTPTTMVYDLFDRMTVAIDERGNESRRTYDLASHVIETSFVGETGSDAGGPCARLAQQTITVDEAGRGCDRTTLQRAEFLNSQSPSEPGEPVERTSVGLKDPEGKCVACEDANGNETICSYDTLDRKLEVVDALGNTWRCSFNADNQTIEVVLIEVGSEQTFVSRQLYDELGRPVASVQLGALSSSTDINQEHQLIGNVSRVLYDSRGLVASASDANGPTTASVASSLDRYGPGGAAELGAFPLDPPINGRGNRVRMAYDNLGRSLQTTRELTSDGLGGSSVVDAIVTSQSWDDNSRLATATDPAGNLTSFVYDARDRLVEERKADGATVRLGYDKVSNLVFRKDENGTIRRMRYDQLGRCTAEDISGAPGGAGDYQTTFRRYRYDGRSRMTLAEDNDSRVEWVYDEMSHVREERLLVGDSSRRSPNQALTGRLETTRRDVDGTGALTRMEYPGNQGLQFDLDALNRHIAVNEPFGGAIASFAYIGFKRKTDTYQNGTTTEYRYDGARRLVRIDQRRGSDDQRITGFSYEYDRIGRRRFERELPLNTNPTEASGPGSAYRYDSVSRLVEAQHDVASVDLDALVPNTSAPGIPTSGTNRSDVYSYDLAGNRTNHVRDGASTSYQQNTGGDRERNQYTLIGGLAQAYDLNGNQTAREISAGVNEGRVFDESNRLVQLLRQNKTTSYRYDDRPAHLQRPRRQRHDQSRDFRLRRREGARGAWHRPRLREFHFLRLRPRPRRADPAQGRQLGRALLRPQLHRLGDGPVLALRRQPRRGLSLPPLWRDHGARQRRRGHHRLNRRRGQRGERLSFPGPPIRPRRGQRPLLLPHPLPGPGHRPLHKQGQHRGLG